MKKTASAIILSTLFAFTVTQASTAALKSTCAQLSHTTWKGEVAIGVKTKSLTLNIMNDVTNNGSIEGTVQIDNYHAVKIAQSQCIDEFNVASFVITTGNQDDVFNPLNSSLGGTLVRGQKEMLVQGTVKLDLSPGKIITSKSIFGKIRKE